MRGRAARWFSGRLGTRGRFLVFMGAGKVCFGFSFIFTPPWTLDGLGMLLRFAPLHCWAWLWIICGSATFISAWLTFGRDGIGFVAASVPAAFWAFTYGWSGLLGEYPRGLFLFGWYMTSHCGVIWCASRIPPESRSPESHGRVVEGRPG